MFHRDNDFDDMFAYAAELYTLCILSYLKKNPEEVRNNQSLLECIMGLSFSSKYKGNFQHKISSYNCRDSGEIDQ